jgi:phosphoribosylglycinamide formyltransferase-1
LSGPLLPVVVLISGRGSNLKAIVDAIAHEALPVEIRAVISNRPDAPGLQFARGAGIPMSIVDHRAFADRTRFEQALADAIDAHAPKLVVLAGFMRVLGADFVNRYRGRMINIHPSLLPEFPGLDTHARALAAARTRHGATVHFVTPDVDGGPVIVQAAVPILAGDTSETLAARVLEQEHRILPLALRWFSENRIGIRDGHVLLDGRERAREELVS